MFDIKEINKDRLRIVSEVVFLLIFIGLFLNKSLQSWIIIFAGGVLISFIFGRYFCGWLCPTGNLLRFQSWLYQKLGITRLQTPDILKNSWLRWLWLIIFVGVMIAARRTGLKLNMVLYITFLGVIISLLFEEELWHKFICPYGTILQVTDRTARYEMNVDRDKCSGCGLCQQVCPNNNIETLADNTRGINANECLLCYKCEEVCPVGAISYSKR